MYDLEDILPSYDSQNRLPDVTLSTHRYRWGDFVAVSSLWGDESPSMERAIIVNNRRVRVRENLEAALKVVRDSIEVKSGFKLRVDALCISQDDLQERSHQVSVMRDIYARSCVALAWIGLNRDESDLAADLVNDWIDLELLDNVNLAYSPKNLGWAPETIAKAVKAILAVCYSPYWRRVWIIQDIVLGGTSTTVLCRQKRFKWIRLGGCLHAIRMLRMRSQHTRLAGDHIVEMLSDDDFKELGVLTPLLNISTGRYRSDGGLLDPRIMIGLSPNASSMDPRDKIYGFLGLLGLHIPSCITPKYDVPVSEVYADFAKAVIKLEGNPRPILEAAYVLSRESFALLAIMDY